MALCRNDVVPGGVRAGGEFPNVVRDLDDEGVVQVAGQQENRLSQSQKSNSSSRSSRNTVHASHFVIGSGASSGGICGATSIQRPAGHAHLTAFLRTSCTFSSW